MASNADSLIEVNECNCLISTVKLRNRQFGTHTLPVKGAAYTSAMVVPVLGNPNSSGKATAWLVLLLVVVWIIMRLSGCLR